MKKVIRPMVFETNSSSTDSISITNNIIMCTQDDFNKWENGEILYDRANNSLINLENLREKYIDGAIILYKEICKKDKYRILWDNLPVLSQDEWIDQYIKSNYNNYLTYEAFENFYSQVDIAKFVASNGEIIVSICACTYD